MKTLIILLAFLGCAIGLQAQQMEFDQTTIDYGTIEKNADGSTLAVCGEKCPEVRHCQEILPRW